MTPEEALAFLDDHECFAERGADHWVVVVFADAIVARGFGPSLLLATTACKADLEMVRTLPPQRSGGQRRTRRKRVNRR